MIKKIAIALVCLLIVVALCFAGWWFFLKPTPLLGTVDNSHKVTFYLGERMYYDVLIPNEAQLIDTDETSIYRYDLLTVGMQDSEPLSDYKVQVLGRWFFVDSEDKWVAPTAYGFENQQPYRVDLRYEYTEFTDPYTNEVITVNWADGPAPSYTNAPDSYMGGTQVWTENSYILDSDTFTRYEDGVEDLLSRLCALTDGFVPHYYNDGNLFYAQSEGYIVGMKYINFNTQRTIIAHGTEGCAAALNILAGEG